MIALRILRESLLKSGLKLNHIDLMLDFRFQSISYFSVKDWHEFFIIQDLLFENMMLL